MPDRTEVSAARRSRTAAVGAVLLVLLAAQSADAIVVRHDNSAACMAALPRCEAKCLQDYIFVCASSGVEVMMTQAPLVRCTCANQAGAATRNQVARLVLEPASAATCSAAALPAECAAQLTAAVNGSAVSLEPLGPACAAATGIVTGPNGHSAAVAFPRSPVGVIASGLDGFVTIEFGRGHEGDAANRAWSGCSLRYRVVQGSFLGATEIPAAVEAGVATRQQQEQHALALLQQQHPHHPAAGQVRQRDAGGVSAVEAPRWGAAPMRMGMPGAAGIASFRAASISGAAFHPPVN